jgi:hypothetical protein
MKMLLYKTRHMPHTINAHLCTYSVLLTLIALLLVLLDESVEINHDVLWFTLCEQEREWPSHTLYTVSHT